MSAPGVGDLVTVMVVDQDPYPLHISRHVRVVAVVDDGYMVTVDSVPLGEALGPIPADRIQPGWRDQNGKWR